MSKLADRVAKAMELPDVVPGNSQHERSVSIGEEKENARTKELVAALIECVSVLEFYKAALQQAAGLGEPNLEMHLMPRPLGTFANEAITALAAALEKVEGK